MKVMITCVILILVTACSNTSSVDGKHTEKNTQTTEANKNDEKEATPSKNKNNTASQATTPAVKKTVIFNQSTVDQLYPGWVLKLNQLIKYPDHDVVVVGLQKEGSTWGREGKVVVLQSDSVGNWSANWSGDILTGEEFPFYEFQSMAVLKSTSKKQAIAVVAADTGGSTGFGQVITLLIGENGKTSLKKTFDVNAMSVEQKDTKIVVSGDQQFGTHELSFNEEQFVDSKTSASDLSPDGAVQVNFKLDPNEDIVLLGQDTLNMSVGQTISFIPADDKTRAAFEQGIIGIYSDAWNSGAPLNTSNSDRLWEGNSYTFDHGGEVHFLLVTDDKVVSLPFENPIPTITINVQP